MTEDLRFKVIDQFAMYVIILTHWMLCSLSVEGSTLATVVQLCEVRVNWYVVTKQHWQSTRYLVCPGQHVKDCCSTVEH